MHQLLEQMAAGQLTVLTVMAWAVVGGAVSMLGGVMGGMFMGGKEIGHDLAAMMGALFGPTAAAPVIFVGLIVLAWLRA